MCIKYFIFITVLSCEGVYKCKKNILKTKHLPNIYVQYHISLFVLLYI